MEVEKKNVAPPSAVLKTYWKYSRTRWGYLALTLLSGIGMQVVSLTAPLYMKQFFNTLALQTPSETAAATLLGILWIIAALWVADRLLRRLQDHANTYFQLGIMSRLYEDSFNYLLGHSYNFFASNFAGSLMHRISRFTRAFEIIADNVLTQFFPTALFVIGAVVVLFTRNHVLGIALGIWCILFVWFQLWVARKRQTVRAERAEAETKVTGALADSISNQSTVSLFQSIVHLCFCEICFVLL